MNATWRISLFLLGFSAFGQFGEVHIIDNSSPFLYVGQITTGDLDNNGWNDVIVITKGGNGKLAFYLNNGNGSFGDQQIIGTGVWFSSVTAVDVNNDGWADLITSDQNGAKLFLNTNGVFDAGTTISGIPTNVFSATEAHDFDEDGFQDLVLAADVDAFFLRNSGSSSFSVEPLINPNPVEYYAVDKADMDSDGAMDVVFGTPGPLDVFLNDGNGTFDFLMRVDEGGLGFSAHTVDVDGNGTFDVLYSGGSSSIYLSINPGDGTLNNPVIVNSSIRAETIDTYDIDGDGLTDIYAVDQSKIVWIKNLGNLSFSSIQTIVDNPNLSSSRGAIADLNNDDTQDIIWYAYDTALEENNLAYQLTDTNLGVLDQPEIDFKIYPNPVSEKLYIRVENGVVNKLSVYSITGQKVFETTNFDNYIPVSQLSKGMYYLEIVSEEGRTVRKFIKK